MAILKVRDENGNITEILTIKGDKGEQGPQGIQGEKGEKGDTPTVDLSDYYTKSETDSLIGDIETLLGGV